jgi:hypothetical protein
MRNNNMPFVAAIGRGAGEIATDGFMYEAVKKKKPEGIATIRGSSKESKQHDSKWR